jgi:hypothetical protein
MPKFLLIQAWAEYEYGGANPGLDVATFDRDGLVAWLNERRARRANALAEQRSAHAARLQPNYIGQSKDAWAEDRAFMLNWFDETLHGVEAEFRERVAAIDAATVGTQLDGPDIGSGRGGGRTRIIAVPDDWPADPSSPEEPNP